MLNFIPYQSSIEETYVKALNEPDPEVRILALQGLKFSPDVALRQSLVKVKNDQSKKVRESAEDLMAAIIVEKSSNQLKYNSESLKNIRSVFMQQ